MLEGYELDIDGIVSWIKEHGFKTVGIQLPEGLRTKHFRIADVVEDLTGAITVYVAEPCFGACDMADIKLDILGVDCLVHIGHTPIGKDHRIPVHYERLDSTVKIEKMIEKVIENNTHLLVSPVGLLTTAQHLHTLDMAQNLLERHGIKVLMAPGSRAKCEGQVLGCSYRALHSIKKDARSFLFIGSGKFHPLGASLCTDKTVIAADPYTGEVSDMTHEKDRTLRIRHGLITKAKGASSFLIAVSTKSGQHRFALAQRLKKILGENELVARIVAMDAITPENLMGLKGEVIVSTGCPRVALDEANRFDRPIITPPELEVLLDLRKWEDYILDEF